MIGPFGLWKEMGFLKRDLLGFGSKGSLIFPLGWDWAQKEMEFPNLGRLGLRKQSKLLMQSCNSIFLFFYLGCTNRRFTVKTTDSYQKPFRHKSISKLLEEDPDQLD